MRTKTQEFLFWMVTKKMILILNTPPSLEKNENWLNCGSTSSPLWQATSTTPCIFLTFLHKQQQFSSTSIALVLRLLVSYRKRLRMKNGKIKKAKLGLWEFLVILNMSNYKMQILYSQFFPIYPLFPHWFFSLLLLLRLIFRLICSPSPLQCL